MATRVLVVDDDPLNLELVTALLEQERCEVLTANSAEAGLRLAEVHRPGLILMDLGFPGMSGYEATSRLKANFATAAIPVVAFTASAMRGDDALARAAGCDGYLTKPLVREALLETLDHFLSRRAGS